MATAQATLPDVPLWIDNTPVTTNHKYTLLDPKLGNPVSTVSAVVPSSPELSSLLESSSRAFSKWSKTPLVQRQAVLYEAARLIATPEWKEKFTKTYRKETPVSDGMLNIGLTSTEAQFRQLAADAGVVLKGELLEGGDNTILLSREPLGVCYASASWNSPLILTTRAVVTPIICGNSVILKTSEYTSKTQYLFGELLKAAGLPDGVLNIFHVEWNQAPKVVEKIVAHRAVQHVNFTGSTNVGLAVGALAGRHAKPCILELGGKAPAVILPDADLELAVNNILFGAFLHAGQICMSTERIILPPSVSDRFLTLVRAQFASSPLLTAPASSQQVLFHSSSTDHARSLVQDAKDKGAVLITADEPSWVPGTKGGGLSPLVLDKVTKDMRIYTEESFAPVTAIIRAQGESEEELMQLANDADYGLSASVWSKDLQKALRFAGMLDSGAVHVNTPTIGDYANVPHGGWKSSGYGRFNGTEGIREFTHTKTIRIPKDGGHTYPL